MYKYDIPYPKKDQFSLCSCYDGKSWAPLNFSKNISYLKTKMKAHRDDMVNAGYDDIIHYCIKDPEQKIIYTQTYQKGVKGGSTVPYHKESVKPKINYKQVYLYDYSEDIVTEKKPDIFPVAVYDVICDDDGKLLTDLKLLKLLNDFLFYCHVPVMVTKKARVSIATYLPQSKETFIDLPGCGEKMFDKCGDTIIELINKYLATKHHHD